MPKFQDNSYVIRDVENLKRDVSVYHNQNQNKIYEDLKKMFLERELDTYDLMDKLIEKLKEQYQTDPKKLNIINDIWNNYRKMTDKKQFFIRQPLSEITSIEDLLDICNKKATTDMEIVHQFVNSEFLKLNDNITENEIYQKLLSKDYIDSKMKPFYREYQNFILDNLSHKYEKLYKNFTGIFFKTVNRTMDTDRLRTMLSMVGNVEKNKITQHNASVKIGKDLGTQYLKDFK